jgi:salicylate hydroxylase
VERPSCSVIRAIQCKKRIQITKVSLDQLSRLPYLAQGAAQATEDAGTLRAALAEYDDLAEALKAYEKQRLPRAANIVANTRVHQEWLHLHDGQYREKRDDLMQKDDKDNPVFWAHTPRKDWLFSHDAERLLGEEELNIPDLPPMPPESVSVYKNLSVSMGA